jgi:lysophospholipase L1-like esterase
MTWTKQTSGTSSVVSKWANKKINFLGDSITDPNQTYTTKWYYDYLNEQKQFSVVRKYGQSGSSISATNTGQGEFAERYATMDNDADLVVVFGGINDYLSNRAPLGVFADRVVTTFYGACHVLMEGLINKYPTRKIVFMTPIPNPDGDVANTHGITLKQIVDVIKEVAAYYCIPVLDLYTIGGMQTKVTVIKNTYVPDGIHPNVSGHRLIADKLSVFIESI